MRRDLFPTLAIAGSIIVSAVLYVGWKSNLPGPAMPAPSPAAPGPASPDRPAGSPGVVRATRVEVVDATGTLVFVVTSEGGVPVALINDGGTARRLDLAALARKLR
jgi:hypothetical protein